MKTNLKIMDEGGSASGSQVILQSVRSHLFDDKDDNNVSENGIELSSRPLKNELGIGGIDLAQVNFLGQDVIKSARGALEANKKDGIDRLVDRFSIKNTFEKFAEIQFAWIILQAPLLLWYLVVVARAGEINVKCQKVAERFADPLSVSFFVFFEIEIFAFIGIILGLWVWLTTKYMTNCCCSKGVMLKLKTKRAKQLSDQLLRNQVDVFVYTGLFWQATVNLYFLTDLNIAKNIMPES